VTADDAPDRVYVILKAVELFGGTFLRRQGPHPAEQGVDIGIARTDGYLFENRHRSGQIVS
jgi:hypothetical protein